jgi:hypothetical protein
VVAAALLVGGCNSVGAEQRSASRPLLGGDAVSVSVPELGAARRAAWAFARSYAASLRHAGEVPVRAASVALAGELRAQQARVADPLPGPVARVTAVLLVPRSNSRADATMVLRRPGEPGFLIEFVLRRVEGRWLATQLFGN